MNFGRMFSTVRSLAKENKKLSIVVFFDIVWCGFRYGAGYVDYLIFDFVRLSGRQRRTFVTRGINNEFIRKLNCKEHYFKFEDKTVFNSLFDRFIGRGWKSLSAGEEISGFASVDSVVIVKPIDSICGQGIEKISVSEISPASYDRIVEECIVQHDDVARLHPASVNTIRLMTIAGESPVACPTATESSAIPPVHIMFRALRIGSDGNVVDNFNAGGMFVLLDEDGVIVSDAVNKKTEIFSEHPTTGIVFKGYRIPFFKEVEEMVIEAARVVPEVRYVSWDIAVTPSGPVLVEGNHNPGYDLLQSKVYLVSNEYGRLVDFMEVVK